MLVNEKKFVLIPKSYFGNIFKLGIPNPKYNILIFGLYSETVFKRNYKLFIILIECRFVNKPPPHSFCVYNNTAYTYIEPKLFSRNIILLYI